METKHFENEKGRKIYWEEFKQGVRTLGRNRKTSPKTRPDLFYKFIYFIL